MVHDGEVMRPTSETWLTRAIRSLFGWKPGSVRADLQVVLDASAPDETGFSTIERTMLRNILGLNERRIADVMVHRADIIAVKQRHLARRIDGPVRERGAFAPGRISTRPSTTPSASSISATCWRT